MIADGAWGASTVMVALVDRHRRPVRLQPCSAQQVAAHPGSCAPRGPHAAWSRCEARWVAASAQHTLYPQHSVAREGVD